MAERIKIPFGMNTVGGMTTVVSDGGPDVQTETEGRGQFCQLSTHYISQEWLNGLKFCMHIDGCGLYYAEVGRRGFMSSKIYSAR